MNQRWTSDGVVDILPISFFHQYSWISILSDHELCHIGAKFLGKEDPHKQWYSFTHTHTHTHIHTHRLRHTQTEKHTHTNTEKHTHSRTHINTIWTCFSWWDRGRYSWVPNKRGWGGVLAIFSRKKIAKNVLFWQKYRFSWKRKSREMNVWNHYSDHSSSFTPLSIPPCSFVLWLDVRPQPLFGTPLFIWYSKVVVCVRVSVWVCVCVCVCVCLCACVSL